jgi:hypothetical protein
MFEAQTLTDSELIILEDSGVFPRNVSGRNWRLITTSEKFPSVGAKRNAMVAMTTAPYIAVTDDDDLYLPHWLASTAHALSKHQWVRPSQALEWDAPGRLGRYTTNTKGQTDYYYGGQWSYRKDAFERTGGYPLVGNGDDCDWLPKIMKLAGPSGDSICPEFPTPFYVYQREQSQSWHASEMGPGLQGIHRIHAMPRQSIDDFKIELPEHYNAEIPAELKPRKW